MNWTPNGSYGQNLIYSTPEGQHVRGNVALSSSGKNKIITAEVVCDLFPKCQRNDFVMVSDAKDWCEKWVGFAVELLEARKTIIALKKELEMYSSHTASESEVRA